MLLTLATRFFSSRCIMEHKSCIGLFVLLIISTSVRGDFTWLEADPTSNIPTLPADVIEVDDYLEDSKFLFDNLEGGVWRQGWDIKYDDEKWNDEPLNVFVVMHSHNDPGWQKTFEDYFQQQTKGIINTIVNTLDNDPTKRFIWAEISFFSRWWETVDQKMKDKAKKVIANKQLEIVTGGWVMNDEATVHYLATINQLMMGHIWLEQNIGVVPTTGWAIDPFGHSPTMASILNQAGFKAMIINRVHYYIKKVLAWNKSLEFRWRQQWDTDTSNNEMIAHMFPFFSYDIAHTCGPSPKVCSQFEFVNSRTLWGDSVVPITKDNIDERAKLIVDQYKKKAALFKTGNNVMIPLGDDFKYFDQNYMDAMTKNFDPLFKYINENRSKFKVNVRFATLNEYFDAVAKSAEKVVQKGAQSRDYKEFFPVIKGDFFTYDDVREDYWSGYFTSRPFWKNLDRQMEPSMRAAEMLLAWTRGLIPSAKREEFDKQGHFGKLLEGRKLWGIFQHHDGMTGTARKHVVVDYGHMLHTALWNAKTVMQEVLPTLLSKPGASQTITLNVNDEQAQSSDVVHAKLLDLVENEEITLVLYNSLTRPRHEILSIHVNTPKIDIVDADGAAVDFQISPVVRHADLTMETAQYKIYFRAQIAAASVSTLFVRRTTSIKASAVPKIAVVGAQWPSTFLEKNIADSLETELRLSNSFFDVIFDQSTGLMTSVNVRNLNFRSEFKEDYAAYEASGGAYLFLPKGPAKSFAGSSHPIIVIQGSLVSETMTKLPEIVSRTVRLFHVDEYEDNTRYIEVESYVDLKKENREVVNRYTVPSIRNEKKFFTDLNGFSFRQRYIRNDKPIGFNFYPITETAFMQDNSFRFSVHTQQPLGVGTLNTGELELVLDRRLAQDDNRGLAEPVQDNLPMLVKFQLTFEGTPRPAADVDERAVARSLHGLDRALKFNNPVTIFSGVASRDQWQQSFVTDKSMLSPTSAFVVRSDLHLTAFKMRDPHDADPKRRDETIVQVMRYLYDVKDGDGADLSPFALDLSREFDLFTVANARRRSITTILDDPNDEEGVSIQRVATWLTDVAPSSDQVVIRPVSKPPKAKPVPAVQHSSPTKSRAPRPGSGTTTFDHEKPAKSHDIEAHSEHNFYTRFAVFVFIASSALVVYVTWANRRTAVRWFAIIILLSNLINVLIIGYLLNDL